MKFSPLKTQLEQNLLEQDYGQASEKGKVTLGETCIYVKKVTKQLYLPYSDIVWVFRRVEQVNGRLCCGNTTYEIQHLIMVSKDREQFDVLFESKELVEKAIDFIKKQNPEVDTAYSAEKKEKYLGTTE